MPLELTPLRVERDRCDFEGWNRLDSFPDLSGRRSSAPNCSASRGETGKMALSARAKKLVAEITHGNVKLGDLKTRGKEIKKDHALAMELWSMGEYYPRLLSTLIFDNLAAMTRCSANGTRGTRRERSTFNDTVRWAVPVAASSACRKTWGDSKA
jgi:hypothetical protein